MRFIFVKVVLFVDYNPDIVGNSGRIVSGHGDLFSADSITAQVVLLRFSPCRFNSAAIDIAIACYVVESRKSICKDGVAAAVATAHFQLFLSHLYVSVPLAYCEYV